MVPFSIVLAAQGQVMGPGVTGELKTLSDASELMGGSKSPAMPSFCCVSTLSQELLSLVCFARWPDKMPHRARINCEEATGCCRVNAELVLPVWLGNAEGGCEARP